MKKKNKSSSQPVTPHTKPVRNLASDKLYDDSSESFSAAVKMGHLLIYSLWLAMMLAMRSNEAFGPWATGIGVSIMLGFSATCLTLYKKKSCYLEASTLIGALTGLLSSWSLLFFYFKEACNGNLGPFVPALFIGAFWYVGVLGGAMWFLYRVRYKPPTGNYVPPSAVLIGFLTVGVGIIFKQLGGTAIFDKVGMGYVSLFLACGIGLGAYGIPDYLFMRKERIATEAKAKENEEEKTQ